MCVTRALKQFVLFGVFVGRNSTRVFEVISVEPRGEWRRQIANQIARRIDDRARFLFHNGPDSLPRPVGHPLSDGEKKLSVDPPSRELGATSGTLRSGLAL